MSCLAHLPGEDKILEEKFKDWIKQNKPNFVNTEAYSKEQEVRDLIRNKYKNWL